MHVIKDDAAKYYSTHSFRRGGCQYYCCVLKWPIKKICEWGGWSKDFDGNSIVRYLTGQFSDEMEPREEYMAWEE